MPTSPSAALPLPPDMAPLAPSGNPFVTGPFGPVAGESTSHALQTQGQIPPELDGLYVRIGPNPIHLRKPDQHHWFSGDGMVHGVRLQGGEARWYRSRYVESRQASARLGRPIVPGETRRNFIDTVNTNVFAHAGRIWATVEAGPAPVQLDGQLKSIHRGLFDSPTRHPFSAHPHLDPLTGELHAICYDAIQHRALTYVRVNAQGQVDKTEAIPVKHGPMVHDCAITRTRVVVLDLPLTFSWWALLKGEKLPYHWNRRHQPRIGLLPREGSARDMRWFDIEPCFVFHPSNAYDLPDGSVVMDVCVHPFMFDKARPDADLHARFERWTMPAHGTRVVREVLHDAAQEFPRLDERKVGQPYRWAYTVGFDITPYGGQQLYKHDLSALSGAANNSGSGKLGTQAHVFGPQRKPGEFVFVPRGPEEDEGWLIGFVANLETDRGELHVLDARDVTAPAVAIVTLPSRVPMGFHGNWVDASAVRGDLPLS